MGLPVLRRINMNSDVSFNYNFVYLNNLDRRRIPLDPNLPPDLANFDPLIAQIARDQAPRLSFLNPQFKSLDEWKKTKNILKKNDFVREALISVTVLSPVACVSVSVSPVEPREKFV